MATKANDDMNVYLSGAKNMAEAIRQSHQDPFSSAFQMNSSHQGSIAMRMKQNRDAIAGVNQQQVQETPIQFQP